MLRAGAAGVGGTRMGGANWSEPAECNFCGGSVFEAMRSRPEARCAGCGSLERTRLLWMHLERHPIARGTRVLHLAPERCLHDVLRPRAGEGYVAADFEPERYAFAEGCRGIDLCDLDGQTSGSYDLIVHSHVMEHIPCTLAYPLFHLHRMLSPRGRHVCIIPFMGGHYDETFAEIGGGERRRRFGQADHVRRFGAADRARHLGKLLRLPEDYDASHLFGRAALDRARIPEAQWRGFTIATVLDLARDDMLLLRR